MKALIWSCKDVLTRSNDVSVGLRHQATMECAAMYDHNLSVLIGVHIGLFGAAVAHLGSEKHRKYLPLIEDYTMPGCFALTELGHGSNVRGIETIATYDGEEFIIHTPSETAQKYWIGGAALWAKWSAVFANLVLGGENKGVHCFLVRIRNDDGTPVKGVQIADCGHKMGMNGVDNGRIWFDHVRIPRDNLLDRIAQVNAKGEYASKLESVEARFGATMLPLTGGRVSIAMNSINVCKIALTTAIRYSSTRKAFGPVGRPEVPILHYLSHQLRLMPLLATTYAFNFACTDLKMKYVNRDKASAKQVHVLSSGYKALASWHMARTLSECREACGGQGYKSDNRFGSLIADHNISLTFEGDNNVLLQQVSKALLSDPSARPSAPVKNTWRGRRIEESELLGTEFQLGMFKLRKDDLLRRLQERMASTKALGEFESWNACLDVAAELGRAYTELTLLHHFIDARKPNLSPSVHKAFDLLRSLFALSKMDEDPSFLRYQYVDSDTADAIHSSVVALCTKVVDLALPLVQSFGVPDFLLGKIAFDWVAHNSRKNLITRAAL